MNILLLGSGGREHALAWKIAASPLADKLICAPGNAGIARESECVPLDIADHAAMVSFCKANNVDFVVVGPEASPVTARKLAMEFGLGGLMRGEFRADEVTIDGLVSCAIAVPV